MGHMSTLSIRNFEQVIYCNDSDTGLHAIIAIHSTALGPAVGGCRMWNYATDNEALTDALRLSKGMTYKAAISGLNWGGGKSVIMGDPQKAKNPAMLKKFGQFVHRLSGHYISAKDVGITSADLRTMKTQTPWVVGIDGEEKSSGDPSPATAWGVYHGMKACAKAAFGTDSLKGLKVAIQGLGAVSMSLVEHLTKEGAQVWGCDINPAQTTKAQKDFGVTIVEPEKIYDVSCDIFSPCALGASINPQTLPRLKSKIIAGAANNQLSTDDVAYEILKRNMIYAPDYAINAGGLTNIYHEMMIDGGYNHDRAFAHVAKIKDTIEQILTRAQSEKTPTSIIADRMAEERVARAKKNS